jgi:DNA polymerase
VNRKPLIAEALGLGPIWQRRVIDDADQALPCWLDVGLARQSAAPFPDALPADAPPRPASADTPATITQQPVQRTDPVAAPPCAPQDMADTATVLSWDALQAAVHDCRQCRLSQTRTNAVFGRGHDAARWLLVGEAPGEQEDRQGLPFVGRAGKLLDNMLSAAGLSTDRDVYIANVLKCRPPGNRNPQLDEIAACQSFLHQQIAQIKPEIIIALGRFAAQTLLETSDSISRLRGRVHDYRGIPMIVTFHPAYLLRNPPDKNKAWQDWVLAKNTIDRH